MSKYSDEFKQEVVKCYIEKQIGFVEKAKLFNIPSKTTVKKWVRKYQEHGPSGLIRSQNKFDGTFKQNVVQYMHENHLSLQETAIHFNLAGAEIIGRWERIYYEEGPLQQADKVAVTSIYGTRIHPISGKQSKHTGIDLSGVHHDNVLVIADGEVVFAGSQSGYGNCIEIKHNIKGEEFYSFYAHLSKINVMLGGQVTQGTAIAIEGGDPKTDPNVGSSTGHHLHFEIRKASRIWL